MQGVTGGSSPAQIWRAFMGAALPRLAVEAIPGASAVITALCVAGVRAEHFRFVGFLPRSGKRRREALSAIASDRLTSVMFEAPSRIPDTLRDLPAACGEQRIGDSDRGIDATAGRIDNEYECFRVGSFFNGALDDDGESIVNHVFDMADKYIFANGFSFRVIG